MSAASQVKRQELVRVEPLAAMRALIRRRHHGGLPGRATSAARDASADSGTASGSRRVASKACGTSAGEGPDGELVADGQAATAAQRVRP